MNFKSVKEYLDYKTSEEEVIRLCGSNNIFCIHGQYCITNQGYLNLYRQGYNYKTEYIVKNLHRRYKIYNKKNPTQKINAFRRALAEVYTLN